ncbi:YwmB family TATA-box binding protein [Heyndrickxia acidiproducens]|jgi:hypothetical protein|uniref:YwmB family TATA-box binding protein n=1 Tax=Heyndrickxia acidiproducens TaxID=1121084 RepID=UPI00036B37AA|nr:YwmB family TATA-box binding protein [Heyndrickxia acidiproducens]
MKKTGIFWLGIVLVSLILIVMGNKTSAAKYTSDLQLFRQSIEKLGGDVTEWSLYTRESLDQSSDKSWNREARKLHKQFPNMQWEMKVDGHSKVYMGTLKKRHYIETIKLLSTPTNGYTSSYLIYEITGDGLDPAQMPEINQMVTDRTGKLYTKKPMVFSCIKGGFSAKIDKVLLHEKNQLLKNLDAKKVEAVEETNFYAVSGYSPKLSQGIPVKDREMNVQIGLRKSGLGTQTTVVIGTPIITIEY